MFDAYPQRGWPAFHARFRAALSAGCMGIMVNSAALAMADAIGLPTAHGGLLRLVASVSAGRLPEPPAPGFRWAFHIIVGLAMALIYAGAVEPRLRGSACRKGLICAAAAWLLNAGLVLPLTGEGLAGRTHLAIAGMAWFACAHTLFFVITAVLYARWRIAGDAGYRPSIITG